ncbi:LON peptidase substrate-binding domain-containing protein [Williamsia soli]|uniref:LON peptidase substrate-binding domain-containing protein n=1 Tax=Williamsia soli TaxID=364929 RepID=UPI001A9FEDE4|nr:LON peptidase substrate-binding domain-containing protein [Williamsia soli]
MSAHPMFPLGMTLLPGEPLSLQIFEPRYVQMVADCTADTGHNSFGVVLISRGRETGGGEERVDVGTLAQIEECSPRPDGRFHLSCVGTDRFRVRTWLPDDPYPLAEIELWPSTDPVAAPGALNPVIARLGQLAATLDRVRGIEVGDRLTEPLEAEEPLDAKVYGTAVRLGLGPADRQKILSAPGTPARIDALSQALDDLIAVIEFSGLPSD